MPARNPFPADLSDLPAPRRDGAEPEADDPSVPLAHYLWILRRHIWRIVSFVAAALVSTFIVSQRLTPVYESTATITIDRQTPTAIVGEDAARGLTVDSDQFLLTQVRQIQSDAVIRPVLLQFHLAAPDRDGQLDDAPIVLPDLRVTRVPNTYLLQVTYRSPNRFVAAAVANAVAKSYRDYTFELRYRTSSDLTGFMEKQLEELKAKTERSSAALAQFEQDMSMIDPEQKTSIVSARMLQLNTDYGAAQADRVAKETAWRSVQSGTLESLQVSPQGGSLQALVDRMSEAQQKLAELQIHLGIKHPEFVKASVEASEIASQFENARLNAARRVETEYRQATSREEMLKKEFLNTKAEFDALNSKSFQYMSFKREADTDRGLYDELVRKIKEAGINAGFQNDTINLSDRARPALRPVYPDTRSNLMTVLLFSMLLAAAAAIVSDRFDRTIRDPQQARLLLGTRVVASLPVVAGWKGKLIPASLNGINPKTAPFEEAVRGLRNSVILGNTDRPLKSVMFTSASPSEGKTTIAAHFALAHARQKRTTLLVDCDLRRPGLHAVLGVMPLTGLGAALMTGGDWHEKLIGFEAVPDLHLLPAGPSPHGCAELIGPSLKQILSEAESEYDLVVVDSPPTLGFSEPLQMAASVDGVVVVALAGTSNRAAIDEVLSSLRQLRVNILGLVLNEVSASTSDTYYYRGHLASQQKYYTSHKAMK